MSFCRIAICDDNTMDRDYVCGLLEEWAALRRLLIVTEQFPSAESFLFRYAEEKEFDILLLDIEMDDTTGASRADAQGRSQQPVSENSIVRDTGFAAVQSAGISSVRMDGVTLARQVRRDNRTVQIVFITGYSDYIAEGYEVEALHYLMKPLNREKLFEVLDRAVEKRRQKERCLILEVSGEMVRIPFYEIRYLEVHHNYVTVCAKEDYTVKRTLGEFEKELDDQFLRVGRAMILNLSQVSRVTKKEVLLFDGTSLPLPRGAYEMLNRAIIAHT